MKFSELNRGETFRFTTTTGGYVLWRKVSLYQYTKAGDDLAEENRRQRDLACIYGYPLPKLPLRYTVGDTEVEVIKEIT